MTDRLSLLMATKKDFTQVAFAVVQQATGAALRPAPMTERQAASRKGGKTGGVSRAESLTPERRSAIAKKAAAVRWKKP